MLVTQLHNILIPFDFNPFQQQKNIHVKIRVYLEYPVVYLVPGWVPVPGSVSVGLFIFSFQYQ